MLPNPWPFPPALAADDIETDLWQDSEFIKRNEPSGKPVHIIENSRETIETVAIPYAY
jgi:hypothetical protein